MMTEYVDIDIVQEDMANRTMYSQFDMDELMIL